MKNSEGLLHLKLVSLLQGAVICFSLASFADTSTESSGSGVEKAVGTVVLKVVGANQVTKIATDVIGDSGEGMTAFTGEVDNFGSASYFGNVGFKAISGSAQNYVLETYIGNPLGEALGFSTEAGEMPSIITGTAPEILEAGALAEVAIPAAAVGGSTILFGATVYGIKQGSEQLQQFGIDAQKQMGTNLSQSMQMSCASNLFTGSMPPGCSGLVPVDTPQAMNPATGLQFAGNNQGTNIDAAPGLVNNYNSSLPPGLPGMTNIAFPDQTDVYDASSDTMLRQYAGGYSQYMSPAPGQMAPANSLNPQPSQIYNVASICSGDDQSKCQNPATYWSRNTGYIGNCTQESQNPGFMDCQSESGQAINGLPVSNTYTDPNAATDVASACASAPDSDEGIPACIAAPDSDNLLAGDSTLPDGISAPTTGLDSNGVLAIGPDSNANSLGPVAPTTDESNPTEVASNDPPGAGATEADNSVSSTPPAATDPGATPATAASAPDPGAAKRTPASISNCDPSYELLDPAFECQKSIDYLAHGQYEMQASSMAANEIQSHIGSSAVATAAAGASQLTAQQAAQQAANSAADKSIAQAALQAGFGENYGKIRQASSDAYQRSTAAKDPAAYTTVPSPADAAQPAVALVKIIPPLTPDGSVDPVGMNAIKITPGGAAALTTGVPVADAPAIIQNAALKVAQLNQTEQLLATEADSKYTATEHSAAKTAVSGNLARDTSLKSAMQVESLGEQGIQMTGGTTQPAP